ncbi:MAG: RNA methyltransferase [Leptolyngbya sp. RL_3_1]|nr:RNA methyltransferase [Leptolyngbya sp. RL_3_1]
MLTSLQNSLVKQIRKLHQGKFRRAEQQFLVEGTHLLQEALATRYPLGVICSTEAWQVKHAQLWQQAIAVATQAVTVSPAVLTAMATTVSPDGVVAIAPQFSPAALDAPPRLGLAVETLQDPGNLGTLIRTAAAAESDGLWLSADSVEITHPKVLRASAGQWFRLPMQPGTDLLSQIDTWQAKGVQVVATEAQAETPYWALDWRLPTVILLGNEGAGLSAPVKAAVHQTVTIPMAAAVESLNVSIAAAILLFEARRQRLGETAALTHE